MNGRLWVKSEVGKGSCFHFTIELGVCADKPENRPRDDGLLAGTSVLIVDDNPTNRRILTELVVRWEMLPAEAAGGLEALTQLRLATEAGRPFDMVLSDVHMPEMDGFDLARHILNTPSLAKSVILMMTSGERHDDLARCRELGVAAYLIKPVRRTELRTAIAFALAGQSRPLGNPGLSAIDTGRERAGIKGRGFRILLVEDNAVNQYVALRILQKAGHEVLVAANGREALLLMEHAVFDVVLMDIQMPVMDGFEATAAIRI